MNSLNYKIAYRYAIEINFNMKLEIKNETEQEKNIRLALVVQDYLKKKNSRTSRKAKMLSFCPINHILPELSNINFFIKYMTAKT